MPNDDAIKRTFGEWLALSREDRAKLGLPKSQAKWAEQYGITPRTVTRWKEDPLVVSTRNRAMARQGGTEPQPADEVDTSGGLSTLKSELLAKALTGNEKAIDSYMRWFGKDELEREMRAAEAGMTSMSDAELVATILEGIGTEAIQAWLASGSDGLKTYLKGQHVGP